MENKDENKILKIDYELKTEFMDDEPLEKLEDQFME